MHNYDLTHNEQTVLDCLELKEGKTTRHIVEETHIFDENVMTILKSLQIKGLAAVPYGYKANPKRWVAL